MHYSFFISTYANIRFFHSFISSLCYSMLCILAVCIEFAWSNFMDFHHLKTMNLSSSLKDYFHIQYLPFLLIVLFLFSFSLKKAAIPTTKSKNIAQNIFLIFSFVKMSLYRLIYGHLLEE